MPKFRYVIMAQILDGTWVRSLGYHKTYKSAEQALEEMAFHIHVSGEFLQIWIMKTIAFNASGPAVSMNDQ